MQIAIQIRTYIRVYYFYWIFLVCFLFWHKRYRVCFDIHETQSFPVSCSQFCFKPPLLWTPLLVWTRECNESETSEISFPRKCCAESSSACENGLRHIRVRPARPQSLLPTRDRLGETVDSVRPGVHCILQLAPIESDRLRTCCCSKIDTLCAP